MKTNSLKLVVALLTSSAVPAFAASVGTGGEEVGLLIWALIGFAVLVVMLQAVPATIMLYAMLKALFASGDKVAIAPKA